MHKITIVLLAHLQNQKLMLRLQPRCSIFLTGNNNIIHLLLCSWCSIYYNTVVTTSFVLCHVYLKFTATLRAMSCLLNNLILFAKVLPQISQCSRLVDFQV